MTAATSFCMLDWYGNTDCWSVTGQYGSYVCTRNSKSPGLVLRLVHQRNGEITTGDYWFTFSIPSSKYDAYSVVVNYFSLYGSCDSFNFEINYNSQGTYDSSGCISVPSNCNNHSFSTSLQAVTYMDATGVPWTYCRGIPPLTSSPTPPLRPAVPPGNNTHSFEISGTVFGYIFVGGICVCGLGVLLISLIYERCEKSWPRSSAPAKTPAPTPNVEMEIVGGVNDVLRSHRDRSTPLPRDYTETGRARGGSAVSQQKMPFQSSTTGEGHRKTAYSETTSASATLARPAELMAVPRPQYIPHATLVSEGSSTRNNTASTSGCEYPHATVVDTESQYPRATVVTESDSLDIT